MGCVTFVFLYFLLFMPSYFVVDQLTSNDSNEGPIAALLSLVASFVVVRVTPSIAAAYANKQEAAKAQREKVEQEAKAAIWRKEQEVEDAIRQKERDEQAMKEMAERTRQFLEEEKLEQQTALALRQQEELEAKEQESRINNILEQAARTGAKVKIYREVGDAEIEITLDPADIKRMKKEQEAEEKQAEAEVELKAARKKRVHFPRK